MLEKDIAHYFLGNKLDAVLLTKSEITNVKDPKEFRFLKSKKYKLLFKDKESTITRIFEKDITGLYVGDETFSAKPYLFKMTYKNKGNFMSYNENDKIATYIFEKSHTLPLWSKGGFLYNIGKNMLKKC